jgi:hypothetical protein
LHVVILFSLTEVNAARAHFVARRRSAIRVYFPAGFPEAT